MHASFAVRSVYHQSSSVTWPDPSSPLVPSEAASSRETSGMGCLVAHSWGQQVGIMNDRNLGQSVSMQRISGGIGQVACSPPQIGATHLPVSILPVPAADLIDLVVPHFRDLMACSLVLAVALVAAPVFAGTSCRRLALAHIVVAVVGVFGLGLAVVVVVVVVARTHRTAAPAPICPAGHNTHHSTGRSCPGHGRSRNIAGHTADRSPRAVVAAVPVASVLGRSIAAAAVADGGRIVAAGTP
jgi:hypothetical protein